MKKKLDISLHNLIRQIYQMTNELHKYNYNK